MCVYVSLGSRIIVSTHPFSHPAFTTHKHKQTPLNRYLRTAELEKLCKAIAAFGKGAPVALKEGAAKGVAVPPAVRALLEALCEEG